jgi:3D (Asp-Asp-Asp) domain-containing protein
MTLSTLLLTALLAATIPVPDRSPDKVCLATGYQPNQTVTNCGRDNRPHIDKATGGGPNAAWTGQRLEDWHCAVSQFRPRSFEYGTILAIGHPVNRKVLVVDCGPAVRSNQVDVCFIWSKHYKAFEKAQGEYGTRRVNVWKVGKVSREEARRWKP